MLASSVSCFTDLKLLPIIKVKIQKFNVYFSLCHMYGTKCGVKIKELLNYNLTMGSPKIRNS